MDGRSPDAGVPDEGSGTPVDRERVEEVFEEALGRPPRDRTGFVQEVCGDDAALTAAVLRLLRAHERAEGVLEDGPEVSAARILDAVHEDESHAREEERIGPYRIRDELGRGGTGVVYLAERADGQFQRRVALKVIRVAGDEHLEARVLAERQILASLDHPNIARLLDAGVTGDGRFFLVMELVDGLPLDRYCDRMGLSVAERLRLFVEVAEVVEYAHRNLVVHRDLKPSNILVTSDARVKLLDFGIAKLLNPSLAGVAAPVTRRGSMVLTPGYASPEQLRGETLTTGTDVYSLGVILYELLTGHPPRQPDGESAAAHLEAITRADPIRPSLRVGQPGTRAGEEGRPRIAEPEEVAGDRGSTPERLARRLSGDLDAIVLRALRPEPPRRYGSAGSLAQDVKRHLAGRPVEAHGDDRAYRLGKFLRRHTVESVSAGVVLLFLLVGLAVTVLQAGIVTRERDRAAEALVQAEAALAESQAMSEFLIALFEAGDPLVGESDRITAQDLIDRGTRRVDDLEDEPVVQASMLDVLGRIQRHLGAYDVADDLLERAVELRRAELGPLHPDLATSLVNLARVRRDRGRPAEAQALVEEALAIRRGAGEPDAALAEAVFEKAWLAEGADQEALYREALRIHRDAGGDVARRTAMVDALATNLRRQGKLGQAVATAREAFELARSSLGADHPETAIAMYHLADHLRDVEEDYEEAGRLYRRGIEIHAREYGPVSLQLIHGLNALAILQDRQGEHVEAEELFRRALEIRRQATGPDNPALAGAMDNLAGALARQGRLGEAESLVRDALAHRDRTQGPRDEARHRSLATLGWILSLRDRWDEAQEAWNEALTLRLDALGRDDIVLAELRRRWGRILSESGRFEEAEPLLLTALDGLRRSYEPDHPNRVDGRRALHELYTAWGRPEQAEAFQVPDGSFYPY